MFRCWLNLLKRIPASEAELETAVVQLEKDIDRVELQATMSEPEDICAAYVQVQAGEGGTDSADWAQMLLRNVRAMGRASRIQD